MASVPNTNTFSLQDVVNVIGCAGNLNSCFSFAIDSYFDPSYKGSKNNLLNFRDYTQPYISCSPTSCRFHYNKIAVDNPVVTVSYGTQWGNTYILGWTTGTHFTYSQAGDTYTITCNGNNTSGSSWSDTLTFTLTGGLTATFSAIQFTSPN